MGRGNLINLGGTKTQSHKIPEETGGQFHETTLSIKSAQLERNLLSTKGKVSINFQKNFARWSFPLNFCLVKLAPGPDPMKKCLCKILLFDRADKSQV